MDERILRHAADSHREDIMQPYDVLMDLSGFDAICAIGDYFGGSTVYMPRTNAIFQRCLELEALKEFNGSNYRLLVRKYGMSESFWRKTIHNRINGKK